MGQASCACLHSDGCKLTTPLDQLSFDASIRPSEGVCDIKCSSCDHVVESKAKDAGVPLEAAFRRRRHLTRQAAGHGGDSILKDMESLVTSNGAPLYIMKAFDAQEASNYQRLQEMNDPMVRWTARFTGEVTLGETTDGSRRYMRLANLLAPFDTGPHVMDCKVGIRSFTESEVAKKALRPDLYKRMLELDPNEPTEEERKAEACTKFRWMQFNDRYTHLAELGFRIDGIAHSGPGGEAPKSELKAAHTSEQVARNILKHFLPKSRGPSDTSGDAGIRHARRCVAELVLEELRQMQAAMAASTWVRTHEFVGCSLLFVADGHGPSAGVFLIDFAKLQPLPPGVEIDHRSPWIPGNHEDGLFVGIAGLVKCWTDVLKLLPEA
mmetsp:Transcript_6583/g.18807  ORF Transcript_6583/g.18807 Transcript_6583/m.18807 type:complete len:381 (+) Transcript_6583:80-1222(+)